MDKEQAWKQICRQIKSDDRKIAGVVLSLLLVVAGAFTLVFYVGIVLVIAGGLLLTITVKTGRNQTLSVDSVYEKYILPQWLCEILDDVVFDADYGYSEEEIGQLQEAGLFEGEWLDMLCDRSFTCQYKGYKLRAAQVILSGKAEDEFKNSKWDYDEPDYLFWGRVWQVEIKLDRQQAAEIIKEIQMIDENRWSAVYFGGRLTFAHNLYDNMGAYPWWLPAPSKDNMDVEALKNTAQEHIRPYTEVCINIIFKNNE